MLKVIICITILTAVCCAQKHLICSITDDALNQQSPQTPQRALQSSPGKRGPRGQVGLRGRSGRKGEPGVSNDRQINLLRDQLNSLSQEMEALKNQSKGNQLQDQINSLSQEIKTLKNASKRTLTLIPLGSKLLYFPPDFYIYELIPDRQSWQESRQYCRNWGGDLAVYGVKTLDNRKKLIQKLAINKDYVWIGANNFASEGNWIWVNGEDASSSELIWKDGQPDGQGRNQDCLGMRGTSPVGLAHDLTCSDPNLGLCEKELLF